MSTQESYDGLEALDPFFALMHSALSPVADGEHYLDMLADDVVFDYPFAAPTGPRVIEGKQTFIAYLGGYGSRLNLDAMSDLVVHQTSGQGVIILEYASHGSGVKTGQPYNNHYISVVTIRDRKIVHWRDYWNLLAVIAAVGDLTPVLEQLKA